MKEHFGRNLKALRAIYGDTQADLAKKLSVSKQTIVNWEKGRTFPKMQILDEIAKTYHCCAEDLLKDKRKV